MGCAVLSDISNVQTQPTKKRKQERKTKDMIVWSGAETASAIAMVGSGVRKDDSGAA